MSFQGRVWVLWDPAGRAVLRAKGAVSLAAPQPFPSLPVLSLAVTCACSDPVPSPSHLVLPPVEGASPGWTVLLTLAWKVLSHPVRTRGPLWWEPLRCHLVLVPKPWSVRAHTGSDSRAWQGCSALCCLQTLPSAIFMDKILASKTF